MIKIILYVRDFGLEWYNSLVTGKLNPYEKSSNNFLIIGGGTDKSNDSKGRRRSGC